MLRLRIANGRVLGDSSGKYTCYKYNGNSVVDYFIYSEDLFEDILSFRVADAIPRLSDHSLISMKMSSIYVPQDVKIEMIDL